MAKSINKTKKTVQSSKSVLTTVADSQYNFLILDVAALNFV